MGGNNYTLHVQSGMGNRLRRLMKYIYRCDRDNEYPLYVLWKNDDYQTKAHFLDLFAPIENVIFGKNPASNRIISKAYGVPKAETLWWCNIYKKLQPNIKFEPRINDMVEKLGEKFISVHVRRTDHQQCKNKNPDSVFFNFIDGFTDDYKIFLATDNKVTQNIFKKKYKDRVFWTADIKGSPNRPPPFTKNGDIVVDIFVCSKAESFRGSTISTLSQTIQRLRDANEEGPSII